MRTLSPASHAVRCTAVAVGLLCASQLHAQTLKMSRQLGRMPMGALVALDPQSQPIGLLTAFDLALSKDLTYASALAAFRAAQELVPQARAGLRPQLALAGSMGVSSSRPQTNTRSADVAHNRLDAVTTTQSTSENSSFSGAQQTGFPQFDTATSTSSRTTGSSTLNEQTTERLESQSWESSTQTAKGSAANAEINLRWPLYRPALDRQVEQSQLNEAQARVRLQAARQDVAVRLCQAYFDVILSQENLRALQSEKAAIAAQRQVAEKSFEAGETTIADVREAQAKWDIVQAQGLAQRNTLQVRLTALQAMIGRRAAAVQTLKTDELLAQPLELGMLADWLQRAAQQSHSVVFETLGLAAAEKEIAKQGAAFKPSLDFVASLSAGRNLQRTRTESSAQSATLSERDEPSQSMQSTQTSASSLRDGQTAAGTSQSNSRGQVWSSSTETTQSSADRPSSTSRASSTQYDAYVGVRLNIPLYDGGLSTSKVREAVARKEQKAMDLERVRADVALATETAYLEAQGFFAEARALKAAEWSGQVALKSNQMGYQAGVRINADILNAQQQLFAVRRDLIKSQVAALLATLRLKASAGALLDGDVARLAEWLQ